ncbi:MAG: hypothetical protein CL581_10850 [Alteromonadaceae bacterium]|nr:hypothetical protein [Alteromonadaceae bacterium]
MCAVPSKLYRDPKFGGDKKKKRGLRAIFFPGGGLNELYERMKGRQSIEGSLDEAKAEQQRRLNPAPRRAPRI